LTVSREIIEALSDTAILDLAIRRFQKTEIVDAGERRQRRDQTDVRAFRRFDRTNTTVVRGMDVANLKPGAIAREAARPQGGQTPLVRQFSQRVDLVHELGKLAAAKEIPD